ncbi:MAG: glycosyltransferase [Methylococcaceae bacterium]|nr:glycosyltransferase [Methylococcaceae bacterium]
MNPKPLVTIGIGTYNCAKFLGEAIQSALAQTYPIIEVLVYDDGSTDNTEQLLRSFHDPRIRIIRSEVNNGIGYARQRLKFECSGDFLVWLDADDRMYPGRIESLLAGHKSTGSDLVIDRYAQIDQRSQTLPGILDVPKFIESDRCFTRLFERNVMLPHPLISRSCFHSIDFDPSLRYSEDYDYWLKCSAAGRTFARIPAVGLEYRITGGSLSSDLASSLRATNVILTKYTTDFIADLYRERNYSDGEINRLRCLRGIYLNILDEAYAAAQNEWHPDQESDRLFYLGTLALRHGDYAVASDSLHQHLASCPNSPAGLNNLGIATSLYKNKHSKKYFINALTLFPNYADALYNRDLKDQNFRITNTYIEFGRIR